MADCLRNDGGATATSSHEISTLRRMFARHLAANFSRRHHAD